jgi:hypothetical protein
VSWFMVNLFGFRPILSTLFFFDFAQDFGTRCPGRRPKSCAKVVVLRGCFSGNFGYFAILLLAVLRLPRREFPNTIPVRPGSQRPSFSTYSCVETYQGQRVCRLTTTSPTMAAASAGP